MTFEIIMFFGSAVLTGTALGIGVCCALMPWLSRRHFENKD